MTVPGLLLLSLVLLALGTLLLGQARTYGRLTPDEERGLEALPTTGLSAEQARLWRGEARRRLTGARRTGARLYLVAGVLMLTCALLVLAMALTLAAVAQSSGGAGPPPQ